MNVVIKLKNNVMLQCCDNVEIWRHGCCKYNFPLTQFWCRDRTGKRRCVPAGKIERHMSGVKERRLPSADKDRSIDCVLYRLLQRSVLKPEGSEWHLGGLWHSSRGISCLVQKAIILSNRTSCCFSLTEQPILCWPLLEQQAHFIVCGCTAPTIQCRIKPRLALRHILKF